MLPQVPLEAIWRRSTQSRERESTNSLPGPKSPTVVDKKNNRHDDNNHEGSISKFGNRHRQRTIFACPGAAVEEGDVCTKYNLNAETYPVAGHERYGPTIAIENLVTPTRSVRDVEADGAQESAIFGGSRKHDVQLGICNGREIQ